MEVIFQQAQLFVSYQKQIDFPLIITPLTNVENFNIFSIDIFSLF
jgi:hypothetical protein